MGNPPFVTARNLTKRELVARTLAKGVLQELPTCCPFFELGFLLFELQIRIHRVERLCEKGIW